MPSGGVKARSGRRGRYTKSIENLVGDNRERALYLVNQYLKDPSIPLRDKIVHAMAITLKLMPDKQEIISLTLNLSDDSARQLIDLANRNLALKQELATFQANSKTLTHATAQDKPASVEPNRGLGVGVEADQATSHAAQTFPTIVHSSKLPADIVKVDVVPGSIAEMAPKIATNEIVKGNLNSTKPNVL